MFNDARFYITCILGLLLLSLLAIFYLPVEKNVPSVLIIGFIALILSEYRAAFEVRQALEIANALKAEHVEQIMQKAVETHEIVKTIAKTQNGH